MVIDFISNINFWLLSNISKEFPLNFRPENVSSKQNKTNKQKKKEKKEKKMKLALRILTGTIFIIYKI